MTDFVDAQLNYYSSCSKVLQDLSKQIGGTGIRNVPPTPKQLNANESSPFTYPINSLPPSFTAKKKAKVLFDYEATDPSEISVSANQVHFYFEIKNI